MAITKNSQIDLNGNEMILDADADTSITADTDDQIDIKVAGSDNIKITASAFEIGTTAPKINLKNTDTSIIADQSLGVIEVESSDGSTGSAGTIAKLDIAASGAFDGSGHGSDFRFTTGATNQSGSIALSEVMRITSTGRVGIGKTDPNYHLVVGGTNPKIQIYDSDGNGQTNLYFGDSGHNLAGYVIYEHDNNHMRLGTSNEDRLKITSDDGAGSYGRAEYTSSWGRFDFGALNSGYHHIQAQTGPSKFYFNVRCEASGGFHTYSDENLKQDITTITGALDSVAKMKGVTFKWKDAANRGGHDAGKQFGVTAQNMLEVDAELPSLDMDPLYNSQDKDGNWVIDGVKEDDKYYTMDYSRLTPFFIEAIKELKTKLEAAEARIATLEGS